MSKRYVFMMFGYVGGGKSHVARWLAKHMNAVHLQADSMRLAMFGKDRPELYTPANKALVNNAMRYAAERVLMNGSASVINDAHHNQRRVRDSMAALARQYDAVPVIIWVTTPEDKAKERIQMRAQTEGHVIFDPNIIENMRRRTDPLGDDEPVIKIDGLQSAEEQQRSFDQQLVALTARPTEGANNNARDRKHYTEEEIKRWLADQPKKPISAKVAIWDAEGRLLLVKPNYKPGWFLVGGMVGPQESPLQAALREVREEVGIQLAPDDLKFSGVRYGISKHRQDYMHLLFDCVLADEQSGAAMITDEELEAMQWASLDSTELDIRDHTYPLLLRAVQYRRGALYDDQDQMYVVSLAQ